jgi:protein SCO1
MRLAPVVLLAVLLTVLSCQPSRPPAEPATRQPPASSVASEGFSVLDREAQWTDAYQRDDAMRPVRPRPIALTMVYTHCAATCPITVSTLQRVERSLADSLRYILVSLDPARDNDSTLRAWGARIGLSPQHWSLWHGSADEVRQFAAAVGVRYQMDASGEIAHSNQILLFDASGALRHRFSGNADPAEFVRAARALMP